MKHVQLKEFTKVLQYIPPYVQMLSHHVAYVARQHLKSKYSNRTVFFANSAIH